MSDKPTYYDLLGVSPDATPEEIRQAYLDKVRHLHPDIDPSPQANEQFLAIQTAYEILVHPERRAEYDTQQASVGQTNFPVRISLNYSRTSLPQIDESQLVYALLNFKPKQNASNRATRIIPPINLALVIDRSTSMQGARMDTVKSTAIELVRQMRKQDILSIITFSDRAEVLLPAGRNPKQQETETAIRLIQPSGGTEMFQGLKTGMFEVQRFANRQRISQMILLTDGRTYGDESDCLKLAEKAAEDGIAISAFGIGDEWNDSFLDQLATNTGGECRYVSSPRQISEMVIGKFQDLGRIYAEHVRLDVKLHPDVQLQYAYRLQPDATPVLIQPTLQLGSIPFDQPLSLLLEFMIDPLNPDTRQQLLAECHLKLNIPSQAHGVTARRLRLARPIDNRLATQPPPREIVRALSTLTLYRMQERAKREIDHGRIEAATLRLQRLATHLLSQEQRDLAHTVLMEAERVQHTQQLSEEGQKKIKFGTRNLLLPGKTQGEDR